MHHQHGSEAACDEPALRCASKVTPAFGSDGTLWLAWMAGGRISVAQFQRRRPAAFQRRSQVTRSAQSRLGAGRPAEDRVDRKGGIALAFSIFKDKAFNGQVLYTRSADGGRSFRRVRPITASNESQRFEALGLDDDGAVFAAWLDKRNRVPAQQRGKKYEGAGLFFASSNDGGATYSEARMAQDNTCECCRLGLAFAGPGRPVSCSGTFLRAASAITRSLRLPIRRRRVKFTGSAGTIGRSPHAPIMDRACRFRRRAPTMWRGTPMARCARDCSMRARATAARLSPPLAIGRPDRNPSRPYVLAGPHESAMVWKEFDGEKTTVNLMTSRDDGETWSPPKPYRARRIVRSSLAGLDGRRSIYPG